MPCWRCLGVMLLAGAAAGLGQAARQGDLEVALVVVVPVVYGSGAWAFLGIACLMGAVVAFLLEAADSLPGRPPGGTRQEGPGFGREPGGGDPGRPDEAGSRGEPWADEAGESGGGWFRGGGVIMLGPIPIVLGSDKRTTMVLMGLGVLLMALGLAWWVLVGR